MITIERDTTLSAPAAAPECERPVFRWTEDSRIVRGCADKGARAAR
ncbi:MAG: hypothetical protein HYV14_07100 [Elusimicrobia bacterium]|nr:hypothetical protein [Elusimicrobiota bacterium]